MILFVHQTLTFLFLEVNAREVQFSKFSIESKGYEEGCRSWRGGCQDEIDYSNFKKVLHSKVTRSSGLQRSASSSVDPSRHTQVNYALLCGVSCPFQCSGALHQAGGAG